jgi:hypothetical protein
MKIRSCLTVLLVLPLWTANTTPAHAPANSGHHISHATDVRGMVPPQELGINTQPTCGNYTLSRGEVELLDKYQLDCPIKLTAESAWYMTPLSVKFMTEYLDMHRAEIAGVGQPAHKVIVRRLRVVPDGGIFKGGVFISLAVEDNSGLSVGEEAKIIKAALTKLSPLFNGGIDEDSLLGSVTSASLEQLKPEFLDRGRVNFKKVWQQVLLAVETVQALRIDPDTEKTGESAFEIRTFPRTVPHGEPGFLVFEEVKVSMNLKDENSVRLDILSNVCRRRRSARNCVDIQLAEQTDLEVTGRLSSSSSSETPVAKAIMKAIKR